MDSEKSGQFLSSKDSRDRQRQTAADIARKKVLAAYNSNAKNTEKSTSITRNFSSSTVQPRVQVQAQAQTQTQSQAQSQSSAQQQSQPSSTNLSTPTSMASYKQTPIATTVTEKRDTKAEWQKYHSAWQNYYQKYYGEYYAKAAQSYVKNETEKVKEKVKSEYRNRNLGETADLSLIMENLPNDPTEEEEKGIMDSLKQKIREKAVNKVSHSRKVKRFIPIIAGVTAILLILFLQYNRLIFAPIMAYVSPGNSDDSGITALDPTVTTAVGPDNRLLIPKLNVDVPVNFGIPNDENSINAAMENGVAQFSIPGANAMPGEIGNLVITGHSAGDIYSNNQYKFIFSGLERLNVGDLIYIDYQGTRYTYSVTGFETVEPSNVAALVYETNKPMLTLITCTPLGTARYRLLVSAEQINPVPSGATQSNQEHIDDANTPEITTEVMPKNEPTFFERIWNFLTGNN